MKYLILVLIVIMNFTVLSIQPIPISEISFDDITMENQFVQHKGLAYVSCSNQAYGAELWVLDLKNEEFKLLKDLNPKGSSNPIIMSSNLEKVIFITQNSSVNGIWSTDGTSEGTILLKEAEFEVYSSNGMLDSNEKEFVTFEDKFYFTIFDEVQSKFILWSTDGTLEGTINVSDRLNLYDILELRVVSNNLLAVVLNSENNVLELLNISNEKFTLGELYNGTNSDIENGIMGSNKKLYFISKDSHSSYYRFLNLWSTDGTAEGTVNIFSKEDSVQTWLYNAYFTVFKDKLYISAWSDLIVTDGIIDNTNYLVSESDDYNGVVNFFPNVRFTDKLFFSWKVKGGSTSLWATYGTKESTERLTFSNDGLFDIDLDNNYFQVSVGNNLFFTAKDASSVTKPWVSDGTRQGTHINKAIPYLSSNEREYYTQIGFENSAIFTKIINGSNEIWTSDGTESETYKLFENNNIERDFTLNSLKYDKHIFLVNADGSEFYVYNKDKNIFDIIRIPGFLINRIVSNNLNIIHYNDRFFFFGNFNDDGCKLYSLDESQLKSSVIMTSNKELSYYPNPCYSYINISSNYPIDFSIVNVMGLQESYFKNVSNINIDVLNYSPGIYFIVNGDGNVIGKFCKE